MTATIPPEFQLPATADAEIMALAEALAREYRTFSTEGDPTSGFYEPDITRLRAAFAGLLPRILARSLIGQPDEALPLLPAVAQIVDKFFYLAGDGAGGQTWELLPIADIVRAAELVDFDTQITAEVQASVAPIIAAISLHAPFNVRTPTEAELVADLNHPDEAWGIGFDTLNIYQKDGASGTGSWVLAAAQPLASLPGSASLADLQVLETRIVQLETELAAFANLSARIDRLDSFHPFEAPEFVASIAPVNVPDGLPITPIDISTFVTDADSPSLTFSVDTLPDGLSLNGSIVEGTPTTIDQVVVATFTAEDERAQSDTVQISFTVFDASQPPPVVVEWLPIPDQNVFIGQSITPVNYVDFLTSATGISVLSTNRPPGTSQSNRVLFGRPTASGTFTVTATGTDTTTGAQIVTTHRIIVTIPPFNTDNLTGFEQFSGINFF